MLNEDPHCKDSGAGGTTDTTKPMNHDAPADDNVSKSSSDLSSVNLYSAPDGGWGWLIVVASFIVHLVADGVTFSFGVLYSHLLDSFHESKAKTAWVGSLFMAVPLMTAPIASALTNRYGCRKVTMMSGLISTIGFVLSFFVQTIEGLMFTFGIVTGFGLSMAYVPAVVIVAYYFEKHRAFATGVAVSGSGIGTFVFAPITEWLIEMYGWRGAILILGGFMFNICICGALFRPLDVAQVDKTESETLCEHSPKPNGDSKKPKSIGTSFAASTILEELEPPATHSLLVFPTYLQNDQRSKVLRGIKDNKHIVTGSLRNPELLKKRFEDGNIQTSSTSLTDGSAYKNSTEIEMPNSQSKSKSNRVHLKSISALQPRIRNNTFYRGSLQKTKISRPKSASCPNLRTHLQEVEAEKDAKQGYLCKSAFVKEVKNIIHEMLDAQLLRNSIFLIFCFSSMLLYMWYDVPYVYAPDKAEEMGISLRKASFLVSIIGILSTLGQIVLGYLGDQPCVDSLFLYIVLTSLAGIVTFLVPFLKNYTGLAVYSGAYGFLISANYGLSTIILVELLGMEKLTNAYGLVMLAEGISNLIGPPLAGWMSDWTGSYDLAFYVAGIGILLSGLILLGICWLQHARRRRSKQATTELENGSKIGEEAEPLNNHQVAL